MASKTSERNGAGEKLRDLNVTQDELTKFSKALKDENFRKLLGEYVEEIRDPENRKRYEEEIALLEQERGNDITWIHPQPGHVLKLQTAAGGKAFINVCTNEHVAAPSCARASGDERRGLNWSIPYAQSQPREDRDKTGGACTVYDVVFHPDTLYMAGKNPQMRRLVEQTAIEAVDEVFKTGLKREKIAYPKLQYKGVPQASVIRRRRAGAGDAGDGEGGTTSLPETVVEQLRRQAADMTLGQGSDAGKTPSKPAAAAGGGPANATASAAKTTATTATTATADGRAIETPKYTVVYRDALDMQQFAARTGGRASRPQALVVRIQLPRLTSAAGVDLDVGTRTLKLRSPAGYRLDAVLPLPVRDEAGSATFDRSARCLVVTLPVVPAECVQDSGIDSDGAKNESDDDAYRTGGRAGKGAGGSAPEEKEEAAAGKSEEPEPVEATPAPAPARLYNLPRYSLQQDSARLHITIQEPNIMADSVRVERAERSLTVTASSLGAGLTPLYYRLHLALPAGLAEPTVRCVRDGVTLTAEKEAGDWSGCHVGGDETRLTEQLIAGKPEEPSSAPSAGPSAAPAAGRHSNDNSRHSSDSSRHSSGGSRARCSASASSLCSVTSYDGPQSLSSLSSQSSVDESQQKKGILKKRHCSESSTDDLLSPSGGSLLTGSLVTYDEAEEATIKKSVSFSNHVVEKRYRTTSTIVHDAARTERQRAKKKRQRTARRHSEGDTSENDEFRAAFTDGAGVAAPRPQRRTSSDGDTSENDEFQSSATDGSSSGGGPATQGGKEKKRKNKRKQDRKQKDILNNELMFDLDM